MGRYSDVWMGGSDGDGMDGSSCGYNIRYGCVDACPNRECKDHPALKQKRETPQQPTNDPEYKVLENNEFRVLRKEEYPEGLDDLSYDSFSWLSYWTQGMRPDGYGYAYKVGFKENIRDANGNQTDLRIIFFNLTARHDIDIDKSKLEDVAEQAKTVFNHINQNVHGLAGLGLMEKEEEKDLDPHFTVLTKPLPYMMSDWVESLTKSRMIHEN